MQYLKGTREFAERMESGGKYLGFEAATNLRNPALFWLTLYHGNPSHGVIIELCVLKVYRNFGIFLALGFGQGIYYLERVGYL